MKEKGEGDGARRADVREESPGLLLAPGPGLFSWSVGFWTACAAQTARDFLVADGDEDAFVAFFIPVAVLVVPRDVVMMLVMVVEVTALVGLVVVVFVPLAFVGA
jgi:hypothetical protein